ncbi:siderophore-interacting protein [Streptomyces indicus]|uniref:NADPH-dependent ferric siderophore reductase, contains FAD-binding and SIP domains n=1 Tax=Streptomyces indicus TaxID=417292 RepID=A0A1G9G8F6_9ACTN|nr:siderophore-interacting protein [Streptomyces indicus]SDK96835.1 NADPH-dependent ferric siderophore reductase, contains FAD-binding and SIP domains [Streptomyces indicus]
MTFRLFGLEVIRTERLSPSLARVTFVGYGEDAGLTGFHSGGRDQSCSIFLPQPGQSEPVLPPEQEPGAWYLAYRSMPDEERAVMRSYTVRAQRPEAGEVDIDFALHADGGPACVWAEKAAPGDRVKVLGPADADNTGVRFQLPEAAPWVFLWADETALPAASAILETLPAGLPVRAFFEVPYAADELTPRTAADLKATWLARENGEKALDAIRAAELPAEAPYVWLAGEAGAMKLIRRHLLNDRGYDRRSVSFTGYWRQGASEDRLRDEAAAGVTEED